MNQDVLWMKITLRWDEPKRYKCTLPHYRLTFRAEIYIFFDRLISFPNQLRHWKMEKKKKFRMNLRIKTTRGLYIVSTTRYNPKLSSEFFIWYFGLSYTGTSYGDNIDTFNNNCVKWHCFWILKLTVASSSYTTTFK